MYDRQFEPLNSGEVLFVKDSLQFILSHSTFRTDEFAQALKQQLLEHQIGTMTQEKGGWFSQEGVECEVLRFGSNGWQRGRVRINLEFCPLDTEDLPSQSTSGSQDIDFSSEEESTSPEETPEPYPSNKLEETNATAATAIATGVAATVITSQLVSDSAPESSEMEELGMDFQDVDILEKPTQIEPEDIESIESEEADVNPIVSTEFAEESFEEEIGEVTGVAESVIFDDEDDNLDAEFDLPSDSDNDTSFALESEEVLGIEEELNVEEDFNIDDGLTNDEELSELSDDLVIDNGLVSETEFSTDEDGELSDDLVIDDSLASEGDIELDWDASNDDTDNPEEDLDFADAFGDDSEINPEEISADTPELELDSDSLELEEELDWNSTDASTQLDVDMDWDATSNGSADTPEEDLDFADAFGDDEDLNLDGVELGLTEAAAADKEESFDLDDAFGEEEDFDLASFDNDAEIDLGDSFSDDSDDLDLSKIAQVTEDFDLDSFSNDEAEDNLNQEIVFDDVWQDISEVKK